MNEDGKEIEAEKASQLSEAIADASQRLHVIEQAGYGKFIILNVYTYNNFIVHIIIT